MRKDVEYMLKKDWEPQVPTTDIIIKQTKGFFNRLSGSIRLALGLVVGKDYKNKYKSRTR